MAYCRFQNTLSDLQDCYEHINDDDLSESEKEARDALIDLAQTIAEEYGELGLDEE